MIIRRSSKREVNDHKTILSIYTFENIIMYIHYIYVPETRTETARKRGRSTNWTLRCSVYLTRSAVPSPTSTPARWRFGGKWFPRLLMPFLRRNMGTSRRLLPRKMVSHVTRTVTVARQYTSTGGLVWTNSCLQFMIMYTSYMTLYVLFSSKIPNVLCCVSEHT